MTVTRKLVCKKGRTCENRHTLNRTISAKKYDRKILRFGTLLIIQL